MNGLWYTDLIFFAISLSSSSMAKNQIVRNDIRLSGRVPLSTIAECLGAPPWCEEPVIVSKGSHHPGLVERLPILHSVTKRLETELSIIGKIFPAPKMLTLHQ